MGLSWDEVDGRDTFTVFAFGDSSTYDPAEAAASVEGIDALYLGVSEGDQFSPQLSGGPFWFRVHAVAGGESFSLSEPKGPFWYGVEHSDELAPYPETSFAIFENPEIPVLVLDTRRPVEREDQGNIVGDVHVMWPNAAAVDEGVTHASFQADVLEAWQNFIANDITDEQRGNLDPEYGYRDIHIFVY